MQRGYIRLSTEAPPEDHQRAELAKAGVDPDAIYVDEPPKRRAKDAPRYPQRAYLIQSLRPAAKDVVVISDECVLGSGWDDVMETMARIADKSAVLKVAKTGRVFEWDPRVAQAIDLLRDGEYQRLKLRAKHAGTYATGFQRGGNLVLTGKKKDAAKLAWRDPARSAKSIAAEFGVGVRTLYNYFGNRAEGAPKGRGRTK